MANKIKKVPLQAQFCPVCESKNIRKEEESYGNNVNDEKAGELLIKGRKYRCNDCNAKFSYNLYLKIED